MKQDLRYLNFLAQRGKGNLHPRGKAATRRMIDALGIKDGERLLEIGCGTGETLTEILSVYRVTIDAIDILPEMLKKASLRVKLTGLGNRANFYDVSADDVLPSESSFYDRIYAESVLGFQDHKTITKLMREIYRVLKTGGLFAANDAIWKDDASTEDIERINKSCIEDFGLRQASQMPWKINDWLAFFEETGFQILSSETLSDLQEEKNHERGNSRLYLSQTLSKYFQIRSLLSPSLMRESKNFSRLLKKHADDGKHIESHLFVLRKN